MADDALLDEGEPERQLAQVLHSMPDAVSRIALPPAAQAARVELIADGIVHAAGVTFAVAACRSLLIGTQGHAGMLPAIGVISYAMGLMAMFGCSALYNLAGRSTWRNVYRRLDHAAIFVMIAGTYSPFTLMIGPRGWAMFAFVWSVALGGVAAKLCLSFRFERISVIVYLALGWTILADPAPIFRVIPMSAALLLVGGGLLYSFGVVFHLSSRLRYQNAIWHAFVLAGAACHYVAIARFLEAV